MQRLHKNTPKGQYAFGGWNRSGAGSPAKSPLRMADGTMVSQQRRPLQNIKSPSIPSKKIDG